MTSAISPVVTSEVPKYAYINTTPVGTSTKCTFKKEASMYATAVGSTKIVSTVNKIAS